MANRYEKADDDVYAFVEELLEENYPEHASAGTSFEICFGFAPVGEEGEKVSCAIKENGYPTNGNTRICNLKERVMGRADAEITLDGDAWPDLSGEQRKAVLDHELYKLVVRRDIEGEFLFDTAGRPKLQKRQYDVHIGWFTAVAERNGDNSSERTQAKQLFNSKDGQILFPFASKGKKRLPEPKNELEVV
jgi:hypothetical protein